MKNANMNKRRLEKTTSLFVGNEAITGQQIIQVIIALTAVWASNTAKPTNPL
jgi:hypothetical protein